MSETIAVLVQRINSRLDGIEGVVQIQARLKAFAEELGLDLSFCALPGCGLPFIRRSLDHRFHDPGCKDTYHNKYSRPDGSN
jgi:hypothetical protein